MLTFIRKPGVLVLLLIFTVALSCKTRQPVVPCEDDIPCNVPTEISGRTITDANYSVDLSLLAGEPEFAAALAKHAQLEPLRSIADSLSYILHCRIFYKDLIVFTDYYSLFKNRRDNTWSSSGTIPDTIGISLTPGLSYTEAIAIARQNQCYGSGCPAYRLGIYDLNSGDGTATSKNYKLVWDITAARGEYPEVVVDAQNGKVYYSFDGRME